MKTPVIRALACVCLAVMFSAAAIAQDSTTQPDNLRSEPTSRPSRRDLYRNNRQFNRRNEIAPPSTPTQPTLWEQVGERNIFMKGNQTTLAPDTSGPPPAPPAFVNTPAAAQLILTGVSITDNGKIALLENQEQYSVLRVKIGDPIADGKVVNITLDSLEYQDHNGRIIRVEIGFNLAGGEVWGAGASGSPGSTTQPASGAPRQPGESMEDYLRRRRAAELNH